MEGWGLGVELGVGGRGQGVVCWRVGSGVGGVGGEGWRVGSGG